MGTSVGRRAAHFSSAAQEGDPAAGSSGEVRSVADGGGRTAAPSDGAWRGLQRLDDACGLEAGMEMEKKVLVHGMLGLCILLRSLQQHPPATPAQPRCVLDTEFMNV